MFRQVRSPFVPALGGNSLQVTFLVLVAAMLLAFAASLAVTRFRFRGRRAFVLSILVVQMIPAEAMMISVFQMIDSAQLLNTVVGLGVVYLAGVLPFTIWTLRGFVNGVPVELEEAAMIDGCSRPPARSGRSRSRCSRPGSSRPACSRSCRRGTSSSWRSSS